MFRFVVQYYNTYYIWLTEPRNCLSFLSEGLTIIKEYRLLEQIGGNVLPFCVVSWNVVAGLAVVEHIFELGQTDSVRDPVAPLDGQLLSDNGGTFWSSSHCFRRYQLDRVRAALREYASLWARGNQREYNLDHSIRHQDQAHYERGHEWGFGP